LASDFRDYAAIISFLIKQVIAAPDYAFIGVWGAGIEKGATRPGHTRALIRLGPEPNETTQTLAEWIREYFGTRFQHCAGAVVVELWIGARLF
jgi:hypothetical protein